MNTAREALRLIRKAKTVWLGVVWTADDCRWFRTTKTAAAEQFELTIEAGHGDDACFRMKLREDGDLYIG